MHAVLLCIFALVFPSGATPPEQQWPLELSGVTQQEYREIQRVVARRPDILKPVIRVIRSVYGQVDVFAGRYGHIGDTFDQFQVARRHGRWVISSPVHRVKVAYVTD